MPFFPEPIKKEDQSKQRVILQVRIPLRNHGSCVKRVLSSASRMRKRRDLKASFTVEAALALPLFLFAMVILMTPMKLMNEHRKVQTALETACEEASQYGYILYRINQGDTSAGEAAKGMNPGVAQGLSQAGILLLADHKVRQKVNLKTVGDISLLRSRILEDGETVDLIMDYKLRLPFPVFRLESIPMTSRSCRRAWIGREGGQGSDLGTGSDEDDEIVYVGRGSTRYHRSRTCHYLYNDISAVSYEEVGALRSEGGKRYHACSRCGKGAKPGGMVYVMPSGESYHSDRYCSAIIAYVQAVPLSSVEYLGPCSYCSK